MVIDILNEFIFQTINNTVSDNLLDDIRQNVAFQSLSFDSIISKFTLDFKQSVAFQIMASSFILKSFRTEGITHEILKDYLEQHGD